MSKMKRCSYDMLEVPLHHFRVDKEDGEVFLCTARCCALWSLALATRPQLPEELAKCQPALELPSGERLSFGSLAELALWSAKEALSWASQASAAGS